MDFYSGKQPNLIGPIMKITMSKVMKKPNINNTVSDKVTSYISKFYKDYIVDNKIIISVILIFVIFLAYRYYNKQNIKTIKKEKFTASENKNLFKEIMEYQTKHLKHDNPPSMNPLESPNDDKDEVLYPPDPLPVNIPGSGIVYSRNIYEKPQSNQPFNNTNYNYNNVYENSSRSYHNGTYDTYQNAQDTDIINPFGWSNNFNTNMSNFISPMTNMNNQVSIDYQSILDNMQGNLTDSLKLGPKFIDVNTPDFGMEPPYANH
jgi:hypothetical protein